MTYSLLAFDPETNTIGSVVASYWFAVGSCVPYFRPGVGVVHVQNRTNPELAENIFDHLTNKAPLKTAVEKALIKDSAAERRQVLATTFSGEFFCRSGSDFEGECHDHVGDNCIAAGNIIADKGVITAMVEAFTVNSDKSFVERLLRALEAGEQAGGDSRGKESASLKIFEADYPVAANLQVDLRVDNHQDPLPELRRLYDCYLRQPRPIVR